MPMETEDSSRKYDRVLEIYQRLLSGEILVKEQLDAEEILPKKNVSSVPEFIYQMMDGEPVEVIDAEQWELKVPKKAR